jgi:hypothetical protein
MEFLVNVMPDSGRVSPPSVFPLGSGGVQIEWRVGGIEVDAAIGHSEPGVFWSVGDDDGERLRAAGVPPEWEGTLEESRSVLRSLLSAVDG